MLLESQLINVQLTLCIIIFKKYIYYNIYCIHFAIYNYLNYMSHSHINLWGREARTTLKYVLKKR